MDFVQEIGSLSTLLILFDFLLLKTHHVIHIIRDTFQHILTNIIIFRDFFVIFRDFFDTFWHVSTNVAILQISIFLDFFWQILTTFDRRKVPKNKPMITGPWSRLKNELTELTELSSELSKHNQLICKEKLKMLKMFLSLKEQSKLSTEMELSEVILSDWLNWPKCRSSWLLLLTKLLS